MVLMMRSVMRRRPIIYLALGVLAVATVGILVSRPFSGGETSVSALARETHFHGIAVDPRDADRLYLATHHGLFVLGTDGHAERISETRDDFMGFSPHPSDSNVLYASGHPPGGGNLGIITSNDGGRTWRKLADGVGGPVDFHQMAVSRADPEVIYGVYDGLQKSTDGGRSWERIGPAPQGLLALAASGRHTDTLYGATRQGLFQSTDGGREWQVAHLLKRPATMIHVTNNGEVYAFVVGTGLIRAAEPDLHWQIVHSAFGGDYVLHFAASHGEPRRLYVVTVDPETRSQAILASRDGGATWAEPGTQ